MPPRNRKPADTVPEETTEPATTEPDTNVDSGKTEETNEETKQRDYSRYTPDVVQLGELAVVSGDDVPRLVRERGRVNPFDDAVKESLAQGFYLSDTNAWASGRVASLKGAKVQCRNAAAFADCGVEIRDLPDNPEEPDGAGVIYFRGKPKRIVKTPAPTPEVTGA